MITRTSIRFSKSACARIMGVSASQIKDFRVWDKVCFVVIAGRRPTFVSKKLFNIHFAAYRQGQGQELRAAGKVSRASATRYTVESNSSVHGFHFVDLTPTAVKCSCHDYQNQVEFFGRGICKHGYAAIGQLGLGSLSDYLVAAEMATSSTMYRPKIVTPRASNHRRTAMMAGC